MITKGRQIVGEVVLECCVNTLTCKHFKMSKQERAHARMKVTGTIFYNTVDVANANNQIRIMLMSPKNCKYCV